ncbi:hypothetical protein AMTRI_Chr02g221300 [Amborella trichopoda]
MIILRGFSLLWRTRNLRGLGYLRMTKNPGLSRRDLLEGSEDCLLGSEIHGFRTLEELQIGKIPTEATTRWLRPNEIHAILSNYKLFNVHVKPLDSPENGTIVLFDRKMLRNFRKDGHVWKKKQDGKTVREAHEQLKVGNAERIHVYYAHGLDKPKFARRSYWLLDSEHAHIVLVHYRDTSEDTANGTISSRKESKEAFSLLGRPRALHLSPSTPSTSSSGSSYLDQPVISSEENNPGADSTAYKSAEMGNQFLGAGETRNFESIIHEINTYEWDDLLGRDLSSERAQCDQKDSVAIVNDVLLSNTEGRHASHLMDSNFKRNCVDQEAVNQYTQSAPSETLINDDALQPQDTYNTIMNYVQNNPPGSPGQGQVFYITDISPAWAFATEETKVIVTGYLLETQATLEELNWFCVIGDVTVPAEIIQPGVLRFIAPPHSSGVYDFYLTLDCRTPSSQVYSFEYRPFSSNQVNNIGFSPKVDELEWDDFDVQVRLAHLLFSTTKGLAVLYSKETPKAMREARRFSSLISSYEKEWTSLLKSTKSKNISLSQAKSNLMELTLKGKLWEWLLETVVEGRRPAVKDSHGQGVIHLCAILGYAWAIYPISASGMSINFRDASGWTALHWAAYCGREQMAAVLLSTGANASLVSDPTPDCPGGCTAADLALRKGFEGMAAYLGEKALTAHFRDMHISGHLGSSDEASLENTNDTQNLTEEELCIRDSMAAIRTAANAASQIQAAFREHSFNLRIKAVQLAKPDYEWAIISAMKIQNAYRAHSQRKRTAAAVRIQHRFRTWKIRREFLNMRRQVIKIQAIFRGYQVRRQYCKILWSVGILEKGILRWRQKRKGLRGLQVEPTTPVEIEEDGVPVVEEDFFRIGRKLAEERVDRSFNSVQVMFQSDQARRDYRRLKLKVDAAMLEHDTVHDTDQD